MKVKSESEVAQSYLTLSDPMDCSLPGSSVHGIFQARVLEWGAIAFYEKIIHRRGQNICKMYIWKKMCTEYIKNYIQSVHTIYYSAFSMIQRMLAIWSLVPLPFLKPAWTSGSSRFTYCWSLAWRIHKQDNIIMKWSANTLNNLFNYPCAWLYTLLGSSHCLSSLGQDSSSLPFAPKIISKRNIFT